ncbi:MSCRAMM family protein [Gordonia sp. DT219]|uniref:MSCRAMM family protein n=1 Tax=Gordonia sp. DT219 TaxID=3416658 RepID=UPI003CEBF819
MNFRPRTTALRLACAVAVSAALTSGGGIALADEPPTSDSTTTTTDEPPTTTSTETTTSPDTTTPQTTQSTPSTPASTTTTTPTTTTPTTTTPAPPEGEGTINLSATDTSGAPLPGVVVDFAGPSSGQPIPLPASLNDYPGDYHVTVTTVPAGYRLIGSGGITVHLAVGQTVGHVFVFKRTGGNDGDGFLQIIKRDRIDGHSLGNARFVLATCGGEPLGIEVTGVTGALTRKVHPGCYTAHEYAAPAGYVNDGYTYTFQVTAGQTATQVVYNTPAGHVSQRDPGGRTPLSSIPSGPVNQR